MNVIKCITLLIALLFSISAASKDPWAWQQEEVSRYFAGLADIQLNGWGQLNYKVNTVIEQLILDTNEVYRVIPGQTFSIGQAHIGGWIILDISTATKDQDILAFWLAHEWAHQHLGHQPNMYNPHGNIWRFRATPTADEDAADEWAGGFLARSGYPIEKVLNHLRDLPAAHGDFAHSDGTRRAEIVTEAYKQHSGSDALSLTQGSYCPTVTVDCRHPAHADGDPVQCTHISLAHPQGHLEPCQHACYGQFGLVPCHPMGDLFQCQHQVALHRFDVIPCNHAAHPAGHSEQICE